MTPYELTRSMGFIDEEGLSVELVYTRGGNAAMQALVGGAVDYAATSFDVPVQAFANGAPIRRFAATGRLPLFPLAVAPGETDAIGTLEDLEGTTSAYRLWAMPTTRRFSTSSIRPASTRPR